MAVLYTQHFVQFFDDNGDPLSNGKLFAYSAGTTTPKATYTTEEATVENANPIVLDASGRATVFIDGSYRFDLFDENDVLIKSADNVSSFTSLNDPGDPFFQSFSGTSSQTSFTLTESLGDDSKDVMVFVNDESGDVGYDIQNPSDYTLSGTSLVFDTAPPSGTDNIYVFAPTKLLGAASASAAAAAASEAQAATSASQANAAAGLLDVSSTTSLLIETGSKVFTVSSGLGLSAGQFVLAVSDADVSNYMFGQITSYTGTNLTVDVQAIGGSGTYADWTITLIGIRGIAGPAGGITGGTLTGNIDGDATYKLENMIDPTSAQDYATKAYVDANSVSSSSGTFTPTIETDGTDFTSYTADSASGGYYERLGNIVYFSLYFSTTALTKGSASGNVFIGGLPFTSRASTASTVDGFTSVCMGFGSNWVLSNPARGLLQPNDTKIRLFAGSNGAMTVGNVTAGNGNDIYLSGFYFTE